MKKLLAFMLVLVMALASLASCVNPNKGNNNNGGNNNPPVVEPDDGDNGGGNTDDGNNEGGDNTECTPPLTWTAW